LTFPNSRGKQLVRETNIWNEKMLDVIIPSYGK
jgi:hypothetical protein